MLTMPHKPPSATTGACRTRRSVIMRATSSSGVCGVTVCTSAVQIAVTGDAHRSVAIGIGATARVITTAALIMIVVFASFVIDPDPTVKMLAIGMAFAVLIDASLVRMILVPGIMSLLGAHAWWLPRWMEPVVPNLQLEGSDVALSEPESDATEDVPEPQSDMTEHVPEPASDAAEETKKEPGQAR